MALNSVLSFVEQEDAEFVFIAIEPQDPNAILSQWELVDVTDSDADSELSDADGAVSAAGNVSVIQQASDCSDPAGSISVEDAVQIANLIQIPRIALLENRRVYEYNDREEDEDDEDEDDDGLDDELVPRYLSGKLGRQRMRKLGKRGKMNTSKKLPHQYMKPGCLQGKHGLGLKHTRF